MVNKVFVDTDVIIDHLTDRHPFANSSSMMFELNEQKRIQIHISALSVNNIYYISRRIIGEPKTLKLLDTLIEDVEVIGTTKKEINEAFQTGFKDFEDSIQYVTARTVKGMSAIITRNIKDYRKSEIAVFSPEIYLKSSGEEE